MAGVLSGTKSNDFLLLETSKVVYCATTSVIRSWWKGLLKSKERTVWIERFIVYPVKRIKLSLYLIKLLGLNIF